jgi:hypothetical protein
MARRQTGTPLRGVGQGAQAAPHVARSLSLTHTPPQSWKPGLHWNPQVVPSHVAVALASGAQGVHAAPQWVASVLLTQAAPHMWKPGLHALPQTPAVHVAVAFAAAVQRLVQLPQALGSACVSTQMLEQSVEVVPVQLLSHVAVAPEALQKGVAPEHAVAHAPQWAAVRRSASQPLPASPSQSAKPALQVNPHAPAAQLARALAGVGQGAQLVPQVATEVSLAQPVPQRWKPTLQAKSHAVPSHVAVPLDGIEQAVHDVAPHVAGDALLTQLLPHRCVSGPHAMPQTPATQVALPPVGAAHVWPHEPQLATSVRGLTHAAPQRVDVAPMQPLEQPAAPPGPAPMVHIGVGSTQTARQAPQLVGVVRSASQPSDVVLLQSARPAWQAPVITQAPLAQRTAAMSTPGSSVQSFVHAPQWWTSVRTSTQRVPHISVGEAQPPSTGGASGATSGRASVGAGTSSRASMGEGTSRAPSVALSRAPSVAPSGGDDRPAAGHEQRSKDEGKHAAGR